jgi:excisionase family DNA binding protein
VSNSGIEPLAVDVGTAAGLVGLARATIYPLVMSGELPSFKLGARRLIRVVDLRAWVDGLAEQQGRGPPR